MMLFTFLFLSLSAHAAKPPSVEASGKIETFSATSKNGDYRVTMGGFARVMRVSEKDGAFSCVEKAVKENKKIKISVDMGGRIISCGRN